MNGSEDHQAEALAPEGISPVVRVALELERLAAVISRYLDADASEGVAIDDPVWAAVHERIVTAAETALAVLDEPAVCAFLIGDDLTTSTGNRRDADADGYPA